MLPKFKVPSYGQSADCAVMAGAVGVGIGVGVTVGGTGVEVGAPGTGVGVAVGTVFGTQVPQLGVHNPSYTQTFEVFFAPLQDCVPDPTPGGQSWV